MDQETFFITEVVDEFEVKPSISNIQNKMASHGKPPMTTKNNGVGSDGSFERLRKRRKIMKINNNDKRLLARLVEKEPALWDWNNELHCHGPALSAAWKRVSRHCGRDVASCKTIWKSLKDAVRYRKNKMAKAGADESQDDYDMDSNWELSDCLSFLMDAPAPIAPKYPQTSRAFRIVESEHSSGKRVMPTISSNIPTSADTKLAMSCNDDDTSASESSFSRTAPQKQPEDDPLFVASMVNMANNIKELAKGMMEKQDRQEKTSLKFDYIWRNLDTFFARLPSEDVDALNIEFVQMAYERLKKVQSSQR